MRTPLYKKIQEAILRDIRRGVLKPGDRIPSIREMESSWEVSAIVALRVFKELSRCGIIEKRDGSGYFVSNPGDERSGYNLVCLFRPLRAESETENFGNRILTGIMESALGQGLHFVMPGSSMLLRSRAPDDAAARQMAAELAAVPDKWGVLLDMRFSDYQIRNFLLPAAGSAPVAVAGRKCSVPGVKSSCMPFREAEPQVATLALKSGADFFVNFISNESYGQNSLGDQLFSTKLQELGVDPGNVLELRNSLILKENWEKNMTCVENLIREKKNKRVFCYCGDDLLAYQGALYLESRGIVAGRDYGLMGFGGMKMLLNHSPKIGTVVVPQSELGSNAVKVLNMSEIELCTSYSIQINETL